MQLNDVQSRFKTMVLGQHEDVPTDAEFNDLFNPYHINLETRLHVYRNSVLEKLTGVLALTYPTVQELVGEEFFFQVARLYVRQNPPAQGCVNLYGETFPEFLASLKETKTLPYLHDVARYDWLFNAAYYADDDSALDPLELQNLNANDFPNLKLSLRISAHLIESGYPLTRIREFCGNDNKAPDETLNLDSTTQRLLVFRPDLKVKVVEMNELEFKLLKALRDRRTISEALEPLIEANPNFNFQDFLTKHLTLETFSSFTTK